MNPSPSQRAFTLIELVVVIVIVAVMATLAMVALRSVQRSGRVASCISNLRQIGMGISLYAGENEGNIPYGPKAPPFTSPSNFYPSTGAPTSLISLQKGAPVGLGLLLEKYLAKNPKVLFCPGCDQKIDTEAELAKVGKKQAQCSYYYRHGGNTQLFDNPNTTSSTPEHIRLSNLGENSNGKPIRALVLDSMFLCSDALSSFNIKPRTHHDQKVINILFADGHVSSASNTDNKFAVDVNDPTQARASFGKILQVFEKADEEP